MEPSIRRHEAHRLEFTVETTSLHFFLRTAIPPGKMLQDNFSMSVLCVSLNVGGSAFNQEATSGENPRTSGSIYTIPQRLTVAGEATDKSSTYTRTRELFSA